MAGIPTTIVTRDGFLTVVQNAFAGYGFPIDAPVTYVFPSDMFVTDSDLTPLEEHIDEFLQGLTDWAPSETESDVTEVKTVDVSGSDYAEALANVNHLFLKNQWGDSLPIVPPTEEYVDWILTGTDLDPDEVVSAEGGVLPRGGIATVRLVAASLAMAGGRPEYLPFLIAAVKAMTNPDSAMQSWNATTNSTVPTFVINGPAVTDIRLGSGYSLLGPDPLHPAGQILGRATRIILQDLGGALPGTGSMAMFGGMRITNAFFAEDDEGVPEGWTTWAEDRGYTRDQNVLTFTVTNSMCNLTWNFGEVETNNSSLLMMAGIVGYPNRNRYSHSEVLTMDNMDLDTGLVLMPRAFAQSLADVNGYSKSDVKRFLWENSQYTYEQIVSWGFLANVTKNELYKDIQPGDKVPVCPTPEQMTVLVAGGDQGGHGYFMAPIPQGNVVSVEVELPSNWDDLLDDAEIDLGAAPTSR